MKIEYDLSMSNNNNRDSRENKFARLCVVEKKNNSKIPFSNNYFYFRPVPYSYFRDTSEKSKVYKVERERKSVFYLNGSTILSINKKNRVRF